jgi:protein TonB
MLVPVAVDRYSCAEVDMFGVLLESAPRPAGRRGVTVASVAVHAGVILLGVWATAESGEPIPPTPHEEVAVVFAPPVPASPPVPVSGPPESGSESAPVPAVPDVPVLPGFEVPVGLPPVETALGDPFANTVLETRTTVVGVRRGGSGLAPGVVLDNRTAEKPAFPLAGNAPPVYPDLLRSAAIEGAVEVEFIIDPNGRVRPGSIVSLRVDHPRFLDAVREALASHRYLPAEVAGSPVAVRVRQRFAFELRG